MNLQDWCGTNEWGHKVLLSDNRSNVSRLKRIANQDGVIIRNLDDYRMAELARIIFIESLAKEGRLERVDVVDADRCVFLLYQILKNDHLSFSFIPEECICVQTAREILRVMNIFRKGKKLPEYDTTDDECELQLKALIDQYEKKLEESHLYDDVRLIRNAVEALKKGMITVDYEVGILSYMNSTMTHLEKCFLDALTDTPIILDCSRDSKVEAECFKVYGQGNEIQMAISKILDTTDSEGKKIPYGKINIMYSSPEYETGIMAALSERGIDFRNVSGYSVQDRSYVSLLLSLIGWAKDDYSYESFRVVVNNPVIFMQKDYSFGIKVGIGWGLDRYRLFADKMKNDREAYEALLLKYNIIRRNVDEDGQPLPLKTCSDEYADLISNLVDIFSDISKGPYNVGNIYRGMISFIETCSAARKERYVKARKKKYHDIDAHYLTELRNLRMFFDQIGEEKTWTEALSLIEDVISSMQKADDEDQSAVTIMKMGRMEVLERPYQFCIGLSYDAFCSRLVDSPLISDSRLCELLDVNSGYVEKALEKNAVKKELLLESVKTMPDGKLYFSACDYDTVNFKEMAASEAFRELKLRFGCAEQIQGYRNVLSTNLNYKIDRSAVFDALKKEMPGAAAPEKENDESTKANEEKEEITTENKEEDTAKKKGYVITETVDGFKIVRIPRLSPTKLQTLMSCPWKFDYSIQYFEEKPAEKDVKKWLQADKKGIVFHQVIQEYCDEKLVGKVLSDADCLDEKYLLDIYEKVITEFEILIPKCSEEVFKTEKTLIWKQIRDYFEKIYKELKTGPMKWYVKSCEETLESKEYCIDKEGNEVPTDASCDRIIFSFSGSADRIDAYVDDEGTEHVRIIDYKTGKKKTIEDHIAKYSEIQHVVYSMMVPEEVDYFRFEFPCDENDQLIKQGNEIQELPPVFLKKMADVLLKGNYHRDIDDGDESDSDDNKDDDSSCKYCDYTDICVHRMNLE